MCNAQQGTLVAAVALAAWLVTVRCPPTVAQDTFGPVLTLRTIGALRTISAFMTGAFGPLAAPRGLHLRTRWEEAAGVEPLFATDPAKLQLILANLLSNAVKFTARGGVVLRLGRNPGADAARRPAIRRRRRRTSRSPRWPAC